MSYNLKNVLLDSGREISSLATRLGEKITDKFFWDGKEIEQATLSLRYIRQNLRKENAHLYQELFCISEELHNLKPFKRGFNAKVFTFTSHAEMSERKWILKIGHRISPVEGFGDPSEKDYYLSSKKNLDLLRKQVATYPLLQHLLPEPEAILWVQFPTTDLPATTIIIQPFFSILPLRNVSKTVSSEQREQLLKEFREIQQLSADLADTYQLQMDLLGEGNLAIVEKQSGYHFKLLDIGLTDLTTPLPITHTVMHVAKQTTLTIIENMLQS